MRCRFEMDDNLRRLFRQLLTRKEIERDTTPTPVVNEELHAYIRFGIRIGCDILLLAITVILTADYPFIHLTNRIGTDSTEDLHNLIANRFRVEHGRRFHRRKRHQLHQVVLNHIPQGACPVIILAAVLHT